MEIDSFYGNFMVKLVWRLCGNLIYHVFSILSPENLQTNSTKESPQKVSLSSLFQYNRHTNRSGD